MDTFTENYIKQEPNTIEEEFITVIPATLNDGPPVISVKSEAFVNEYDSLVAVKKEPMTDDGFVNTITPLTTPVPNEIVNTFNTNSPLANSFVIYELEPQEVNDINPQDNATQNVPIITATSQAASNLRLLNANNNSKITKIRPAPPRRIAGSSEPLQKRSLGSILKEALASTSTFGEPKLLNAKAKAQTNNIRNKQRTSECDPTKTLQKSTSVEKIITTKPPILLNTRLLKRKKLTGNTNTGTNLTNKKACYNLQDVEEPKLKRKSSETAKNFAAKNAAIEKLPKACIGKSPTSELTESSNTDSTVKKKIINYIMQKRRVERIKKSQFNQTSASGEQSERIFSSSINNAPTSDTSLTINLKNQQKPQDIVVKAGKLDDFEHKNTIIQSTTTTKETGNSYLSCSLPISTTPLNTLESAPIKEERVDANTLNHLNTIQIPAVNIYSSSHFPAITTLESLDKMVNSETPTSSKIPSEIKVKCLCRLAGDNTSNKEDDLKDFFHKMFQETRKLNKQQQRTVKMSLLQAICEAEEMVEKGKCCCF